MQAEIELLTCFAPRPGYSLEALCGTSYGIDPRILLALVGYTLESIESSIDAATFDSIGRGQILAALSENLRKVVFIRERGLNLAGERSKSSKLELLLCDSIVGRWKRTSKRGSQHSKVLLAIYKSNSPTERYGRLYVGSKNLTAGSCREIGVVIELHAQAARKNPSFQKQLLSFFEEALQPELEGASHIKRKVFEDAIVAMKDSGLGPTVPGLGFLWQSRHGSGVALMDSLLAEANGASRIDLHSPWADPTAVDKFRKASKKTKLHLRCLKDPRYGYKERPQLTVRFDGIPKPIEKMALQQSHAKAYLFSKVPGNVLLFGSANFTASGLGISKTPNTEVLLRWAGKSGQFKELLQKGQGNELDDEDGKTPKLTPEEELQQELFNVEIQLSYSDAKGELIYRFLNRPNSAVTVTHLLLEPIADVGESQFVVVSATTLPELASQQLTQQQFKKVSSRVILSANCAGNVVEADLTVDLPDAFYDARSNLRDLAAFRLAGTQLIQELLNIADFSVAGGKGGSGGGPDDGDRPDGIEAWRAWLERIHLERFLLRLVRMQKRDPKLFEQRIKRLESVVEDLKASEETEFRELGTIVEGAARTLNA